MRNQIAAEKAKFSLLVILKIVRVSLLILEILIKEKQALKLNLRIRTLLGGLKKMQLSITSNYLSIKIIKMLIMNLGIGDMKDRLKHLKFLKHQIGI